MAGLGDSHGVSRLRVELDRSRRPQGHRPGARPVAREGAQRLGFSLSCPVPTMAILMFWCWTRRLGNTDQTAAKRLLVPTAR